MRKEVKIALVGKYTKLEDSYASVAKALQQGTPRSTGEHKTKPTQASVRELRGLGLSPDLIVCRSEKPIDQSVKEKISNFCHVSAEQVICIHDCSSIYRVPILMEGQGISEFFNHRLQLNINLPRPRRFMQKWIDLADRYDNLRKEVKIALVGKYTKLEDSYASVAKALQHAAIAAGYKLNLKYIEASDLERDTKQSDPVAYHEAWQQLCKCDGVIVPGGFGKRGSEGKIEACDWCRKTMKPMLGICLGLQAAVIEFSRHVLGLENANSTEVDPETPHPVVVDMPEHNPGQMGGTMRLGKRKTVFQQNHNSVLRILYGKVESIQERHRHRYEVNPAYVEKLEAAGMKFVGRDVKGERMEMMELAGHPYFVATQFHPEYLSRPLSPSPPYLGLILASIGKLSSYISRGCRLSPRQHHSDEDFSDEDNLVAAANEKLKIVVQE
ncbi:hypothetical protein J437_LFUL003026, partial [Ladona fulva]